jgi:RHS repeat-associated protein
VNGGYGYSGTGTFAEDRYFYHHDHLGSSSYLTNQLGNITQHVEYIPFGEVFVEEKNEKWNTPYKFNGKELDEETGLYYYGARYYDSKMSLFLSVDPLVESTMTPYQYCYQNPLKFIDPTGMAGEGTNDWFWDSKNRRAVWHDSSNSTVNDADGNTLVNIGATTKEAFKNIGAISGRTREVDYTMGINWRRGQTYYQNGEQKSTRGIPVPQGKVFGVLNIYTNASPVLKVGKDGETYFNSIQTDIGVLYSYNTEHGKNPGMVWANVKTPKNEYNLSLDFRPSITQGEGKGYVNYLFNRLSIQYSIDDYIKVSKPMELKISAGFTDVNSKASRIDTTVKFSRGGFIKINTK